MEAVYDVAKYGKKIKSSIKKYGFFAEHNFFHYLYSENEHVKDVFFDFGNERALLAQRDNRNVWYLFPNGVIAPKSERLDLLIEAARHILMRKKAKKFVVELSEDIRKGILNKIKAKNGLRVGRYASVLYWPIYNMDFWNSRLRGSKWKKLRNIRNRFLRKNKVRVADAKDVSGEELKSILFTWLKRRNMHDRVDRSYYLNLINNNFYGLDIAKTLYVNGKASSITAGWRIPNSNSYYSAVGILDYCCRDLGEIANIDDLNRLKRHGFEYVDFGGSDKILLNFKKKFKPQKIYKTYTFSITR